MGEWGGGGGDMQEGAQLDGKGGGGSGGWWGGQGTWFRPKGQAETWSVLSGIGAGEALGGLAAVEELCLHAGNNPPVLGLDTEAEAEGH